MHARAFLALVTTAIAAGCGATDHARHSGHEEPPDDARQAVAFPEPMRTHTLANMRDHLLALQEIQQGLAEGAYDRAAEVAERRLGMTSLSAHGAHDVAKFMPEGMQAIGTEMHRSASRFAVAAVDAGASGNLKPALAALAHVTRQCVACHASYRMK
jgi:hypothetical protein